MKLVKPALFVSLFTFLGLQSLSFAATKTMNFKTDESKVLWEGKKVTGAHNGDVKLKSGQMVFDEKKLTGGTVEIDLASITCDDIKDAEYNKKFIEHMKSDDFFSVKTYPTAKFEITKVSKSKKKDTYDVTGNLTMKGKTNAVSFPMTVMMKDNKTMANAEIKIDRTLWDIRYGSGKFFASLGDKMIDDQFTIKFNVVAE